MATTKRAAALYAVANDTWPAEVPPLTAPEAVRAAAKLWRFALGVSPTVDIYVTSGHRYTGIKRGRRFGLHVNPDNGWRHFVHELSHTLWRRYAPTHPDHGTDHARFEAKMVREVLKRGWLDGTLKSAPKPEPTPAEALAAKHAAERARIETRLAGWQRKAELAANAVSRVEWELAAHNRKVRAAARRAAARRASLSPEAKPAPKRKGPWQLVRERAAAIGVEIDREGGGGWYVTHPDDDNEATTDPLDGSHWCATFAEVAEAVAVYERHVTAQRVAA
jgi:hypothetical protein